MKRTTIGSVMRGMCYGFTALLFAASCTNDNVTQDEKQNKDNIPAGATVFTGTSQPEATTRTAILNHTKGAGASVNWNSTDKIWVKDDGGNWQQSTTTIIPFAANPSYAKFALSGTYTGATHDVLYTNMAVTGTQPQVEIKATQTQSAPNNFDHAGESGDCGIATANGYNFTLNHKASYLCFIPRTNNEYVKRSKLIKIEIMSDDDIAGTYDIAANGALTLASGGSKTITVTTGSGFALDNSTADMSKNATYAVVAPGTHTFRIRYWLRNTTDNPDGTIEGTVSKIVTLNCTAGSIHDITANLNPHDYDGGNYYMWDAQEQYWKGYEWNKGGSQPTLTSQSASSDYPQNSSDVNNRWCNESYPGPGVSNPATHTSCKDLPNANEMSWYIMYGNPCLDYDELWTTMGHLYKRGMWFKKKSVLQAENHYNTEKSADGSTDLRTTYKIYRNTGSILPVADANKYFYLPDLGYYQIGLLGSIGYGFYWSSSADPRNYYSAYALRIMSNFVDVDIYPRGNGFRVEPTLE
ncbi:putative lipoprotein [Segatella salivae F0493]|uniref:Putative lipoprotein n=2 Tax=Segatella salivae TaxID=228604 RepID=U2KXD6_9BACT|nr:putative lipoprotein [Segatella salivae F0493]